VESPSVTVFPRSQRTRVIRTTLHPDFNERFYFLMMEDGHIKCTLHVFDWDRNSKDDSLGKVTFDSNLLHFNSDRGEESNKNSDSSSVQMSTKRVKKWEKLDMGQDGIMYFAFSKLPTHAMFNGD
jgi:Ca2+-dependent lipid-binding protein